MGNNGGMIAMAQSDDTLRANIRYVMDRDGWTITRLASAASTSRPRLSAILSGRDHLSVSKAEEFATALGVPLYVLLMPQPLCERYLQSSELQRA